MHRIRSCPAYVDLDEACSGHCAASVAAVGDHPDTCRSALWTTPRYVYCSSSRDVLPLEPKPLLSKNLQHISLSVCLYLCVTCLYNCPAGISVPIVGRGSACSSGTTVVLLDLASQFTAPSGTLSSWDNATNPSTWEGVACDSHGNVASLDLGGFDLSGRCAVHDAYHYVQALCCSACTP